MVLSVKNLGSNNCKRLRVRLRGVVGARGEGVGVKCSSGRDLATEC